VAAPVPFTVQSERGTVAGSVPARGSDFADLMRRIKAAGLLERRLGYYWARIAVTGGLLAAGWAVFVVVGDSWWQLPVAAFLAFVFGQIGFLGHDAGHRQIFRTRRCQRSGRAAARQPGHRAEFRLVGRQAQPPSRPPQHRGQGPGPRARCGRSAPAGAHRQKAGVMFTNTKTLRSVATAGRAAEPTDGIPCQPLVDPAGSIAPVPGRVEGSIR
jgi:hypothetical protein